MMGAAAARAGLAYILTATAVAGVLGYVVQLSAGVLLVDPARYVAFAGYWSLLYILVSAMSGVQQEVTRATRPSDGVPDARRTGSMRRFVLPLALVLLAVVSAITVAQSVSAGPRVGLATGAALLVGGIGYLAVAILSGVLYGVQIWVAAAALTLADAAIRAVLVVTGLAFSWPQAVIELLISVPFVLAAGLIWMIFRRRVAGRFIMDAGPRVLLRNTAHAVVASTAMGVMITGLPLLLQGAFAGEPPLTTAGIIFAITITRAPIVVPLQALQSYLVSRLRDGASILPRRILLLLGGATGASILLGVIASVIGPPIISVLTGNRYEVNGASVGVIVVGAALVGMLTVTGAALLSAAGHRPYSAGWVTAAVLTAVLLFVPLPMGMRLAAAMLIPPAAGLLIHVTALLRTPSNTAAQGTPGRVR
ncbi:hypothetical protein [Microbacterium caowuchunii]|uniref:Polysaccharide biosynthesis protein n=1 Tax=Microbacterium caowuchunii TaxID=2614638 RepID=A0A5N0T5S5_9MICO|nr:hypothetical protein [Microbacterium caowuchunii]KAA9130138.1 hypothetical protein F6B40_15795 [Microbacterium caowuchunii]